MPDPVETETVNTQPTSEVVEPPKDTPDPGVENPAGVGQPKGFEDLEAANIEITRLRRENAKDRTEAKTRAATEAADAVVAKIAAALGITKTEKVTVDSLQEQLTTKDDKLAKALEAAKTAATQTAIIRAASAANADADLLLDSARFQETLTDVDITDAEAVKTAITTWVAANPKFAATQVVGASTIEHPGGTGEPKKSMTLGAALDKAYAAN